MSCAGTLAPCVKPLPPPHISNRLEPVMNRKQLERCAMAMVMYELFSYIEKHTSGWAHRSAHND